MIAFSSIKLVLRNVGFWKHILQKYEEASGQKINTEKSSIFFSPNTYQEVKDEIFATLGPM